MNASPRDSQIQGGGGRARDNATKLETNGKLDHFRPGRNHILNGPSGEAVSKWMEAYESGELLSKHKFDFYEDAHGNRINLNFFL